MIISDTIIDEGASLSILSSTAWKAIGFPSLLPKFVKLQQRNELTNSDPSKVTVNFEKENHSFERGGSSRAFRLQYTPCT